MADGDRSDDGIRSTVSAARPVAIRAQLEAWEHRLGSIVVPEMVIPIRRRCPSVRRQSYRHPDRVTFAVATGAAVRANETTL